MGICGLAWRGAELGDQRSEAQVPWGTLLADWPLPSGSKEARVMAWIVSVKCLPSCSTATDPRMLQGTQDSKCHVDSWWRRGLARCPLSHGIPRSQMVHPFFLPFPSKTQFLHSDLGRFGGAARPGVWPAGSTPSFYLVSHRQLQLFPACPQRRGDALYHPWLP